MLPPTLLRDSSGPPCTNAAPVTDYLNSSPTQKALHVKGIWEMCNMNINSIFDISPLGSHWILPILNKAGVKILIYSGDQDAAVSVQETMASLDLMNLTKT